MYVLRKAKKNVISSKDGRFTSRALFPHDCKRLVEFYELTIAPRHAENSEAHASGTLESLIVVRGQIEITAGKEPAQRLEEGDAIVFEETCRTGTGIWDPPKRSSISHVLH